jgi:hypothetical protein
MDTGFADATRAYARWLSFYLPLEAEGLAEKRKKMGKGLFPFLRGSFYRWRHQWDAVDAAVREAPALLAAGDVHLENFGTWRDAEGRLVWGVNDFDEAAEMPFTADLVRLATSLLLHHADATEVAHLPAEQGIAAILAGYRSGMGEGGGPFILETAANETLRRVALAGDEPAEEWEKIRGTRGKARPGTPGDAGLRDLLLTSLPQGSRPDPALLTEPKGLGALGRPRWRLVASWNGGLVAREAKATAPSAWAMPARPASAVTDHRRLAAEARRAPDPAFLITERWVVRRLSPEVRKIELPDMAKEADPASAEQVLLEAMGAELANLHRGTARDPGVVQAWLTARPEDWLGTAARAARDRVAEDFAAFRRDPGVVEEVPPPG